MSVESSAKEKQLASEYNNPYKPPQSMTEPYPMIFYVVVAILIALFSGFIAKVFL